MYRSLRLLECRRNFPATSETFGGTNTSVGSGQVYSLIPDSMHFSTWWSPWRFGRVYPSVVALTGGQQLQRHPGFRSVLLPRFTGNFFYPGQRPDTVKKVLSTHINLYQTFITGGRINTCPPSCWRAVGGFRQSGCGIPTELEPALPAGSPALSATHTHTFFFHCYPCSVPMLGQSLAWHSTAQFAALRFSITV